MLDGRDIEIKTAEISKSIETQVGVILKTFPIKYQSFDLCVCSFLGKYFGLFYC